MNLWSHRFSKLAPCLLNMQKIESNWPISRDIQLQNFQGRNPSNFSLVIWKIDDIINSFWLYLAFSSAHFTKTLKWGTFSQSHSMHLWLNAQIENSNLERTLTKVCIRRPVPSTDQALPSCFYFRISWILMKRPWKHFFGSCGFLQGLRS